MVTQSRPAKHLALVAAEGRSGEFICVSPGLEIHVHLQEGRVAWATDSRHPFAFASHLQQTANIDVDAFRALVEECRRERLRLGETLVEWGLASWDSVRASLSHQIGQALGLMASLSTAQTLFLERSYAPYDERLTFDLASFLGGSTRNGHETLVEASEVIPPSTIQRRGLAQHLLDTLEGLAWVEVLEGNHAVEAAPPTETPRTPSGVYEVLSRGTDFVALRSTRGSIVGLTLREPGRSLWCHLDADSTFGSVVSALASAAMPCSTDTRRTLLEPKSGGIEWTLGKCSSARASEVEGFVRRSPELLGCMCLSSAPNSDALFGFGSSELNAEQCSALTRRRAESLTDWQVPAGQRKNDRLSSIGFYLRTMVTGEKEFWCFGAELDPQSGETLWLFTHRQVSQGLGWAYLAALTRTLARVETRLAH